jgi:hypothetical protein
MQNLLLSRYEKRPNFVWKSMPNKGVATAADLRNRQKIDGIPSGNGLTVDPYKGQLKICCCG